jgi:hypothetical protein
VEQKLLGEGENEKKMENSQAEQNPQSHPPATEERLLVWRRCSGPTLGSKMRWAEILDAGGGAATRWSQGASRLGGGRRCRPRQAVGRRRRWLLRAPGRKAAARELFDGRRRPRRLLVQGATRNIIMPSSTWQLSSGPRLVCISCLCI